MLDIVLVIVTYLSFVNREDIDTLGAELVTRCDRLKELSRNQRALCKIYYHHMPLVKTGAKAAVQECQDQFKSHRWNCSTVDNNTVFGKVLEIGSKEMAFVYAIASAAVVHVVSKACKSDTFTTCGCSSKPRPHGLQPDWEWGGCGDNTKYAYGFAKEFVDAVERDNLSPKKSKIKARKAMNLHNNEAGRLAVVRAVSARCRCHGVSGSCNLKTCWSEAPDFNQIGKILRKEHARAVEMRRHNRRQLRARRPRMGLPTATGLIYIEASPDYCRPNPRTGVLGTMGRECIKDSTEPNGCGLLCCGRGFITKEVEVHKPCSCKFQWCCRVRCEKCREIVVKHMCK